MGTYFYILITLDGCKNLSYFEIEYYGDYLANLDLSGEYEFKGGESFPTKSV